MNLTHKTPVKSFVTIVTVGVLLLPLPETVHGYFSDDDAFADRGSFSVGEIQATIEAETPNQILSTSASSSTFILTTTDKSTIETQSRLTFSPQSCGADFYNAIQLEVTTTNSNGAGTFADVALNGVGVPSRYQLDVQVASSITLGQSESCSIVATLETWQVEFPDATNGFSDVETTVITLTISEPSAPQETTPDVVDTIVDETGSIGFLHQSTFRQSLFV